MGRIFSLSQLTALSYSPPRLIQLAADAGYDAVGVRLLPGTGDGVHYPLMDDPAMLRETLARMAGTGVRILDVEVIRIGRDFTLDRYLPAIEMAARLGAQNFPVTCNVDDASWMTECFARLCQAAAPFEVNCNLEFMPWTIVGDVTAAARILKQADATNAGVLVDALHFGRSSSTSAQVNALPKAWLHCAQVCNGSLPGPSTTEGWVHDALHARLLPGEGDIDVGALLVALPAQIPVSVEIPNSVTVDQMGCKAWVAAALRARYSAR